jgi:DNA modification methylase
VSSARWSILDGDCREVMRAMPAESANCVVTSPPYWSLRDYGVDGQLGLEDTPQAFVDGMVEVFEEVRRVLRADGTLWLNLGDTYIGGRTGGVGASSITSGRNHRAVQQAHERSGGPRHRVATGLKPKDLVGIPWRVALALQDAGWYLRADVIWHKPNPMPESVADRPTKAHEYLFLLSRSERYFYDGDAIREPLRPKTLTTYGTTREPKGNDPLGQVKAHNFSRDVPVRAPRLDDDGEPVGANKRSVWTVATQPFHGAHFATFPPKLIEPCILAGCPAGGTVLDPFAGAGTTGLVALRHQRSFVGIEINPKYAALARHRIEGDAPLLNRRPGDAA